MPNKLTSILRKMFHSAISAEILRICKVTTEFQDFIKFAKVEITRIMKPHEKGSIETI